MARQFKVQGTKTYLYWSIGLAVLALWCIKDGWFPSASVIAKNGLPSAPNPEHANFYPFNQVTAVITGIGSFVCIIVHRFVK